MHEALHAACERAGVATHYHDVWGQRLDVATEQLAALLAQFGWGRHAPDDDGAWWAEVAQHDDAAWRHELPAVQVVGAQQAAAFALRVRLPASQRELAWTLTGEDGAALGAGRLPVEAGSETGRREVDGQLRIERVFEIAAGELPLGYHRFAAEGAARPLLLIAAPPHCHLPPQDRRLWGISVQLYSLRSARQWGIGDFGDLLALVPVAARLGAQLIGLSPLHALFLDDPARCSPYSPSSRQHLNALYIDVEALPEYLGCEAARARVAAEDFQRRLAALRASELVDYPGVAAAKLEVLALLHAHFAARRAEADGAERDAAFAAFRAERGGTLQRQAVFDALRAHLRAQDPAAWGWPAWPAEYHDPASPAVERFAREHAQAVEFHAWLQWVAHEQLQAVARRCREEGMAIGLYQDLAVSVDRHGADAWSARDVLAAQASVGAPPDALGPLGQDWGLPPLAPQPLRESGYRLFIDSLRACMRGAGALRIDHVMGLTRLFCMAPGATPAQGAYVHYPAEEMLAIVALESVRQGCVVIGEDLGTVADATRALLARFRLQSYRLLYFEREGADFKPPAVWPHDALVSIGTHDLATLQGWWAGADLQERIRLALFPRPGAAREQLRERAADRVQLMLTLQDAGLLDEAGAARALGEGVLGIPAAAAVHAYLARSPSRLMMVQAEDLLAQQLQANLPGTVDEHPNWRRRLALPADQWLADARVQAIAAAVGAERPAPQGAPPSPEAAAARIPNATYRLQFHAGFTFDDAAAVLPYLKRLGVSHVYCSPIQRARPGSTHGYDVVAHGEINPELGGFEGYARFSQVLRAHGMGQLLDLVPNHMGVLGADNPWWTDVLENGPASAYAEHFDIDWEPLDAELRGKVLLPVLGEAYGRALAAGELTLGFDAGAGRFAIHYHEHRFPLAPATYAQVLAWAEGLAEDAAAAPELASVGYAFAQLPAEPAQREVREREKAIAHERLAALMQSQPALARAVQAAVEAWNRPRARDALHALLEAQHYRLAFWRVASDEINYRRFFDINDLAALRIERPEVFEATQGLALDLAARGWVDGLRIDHPDGLRDPAQYFARLQEGFARRTGRLPPGADAAGRPGRPLYVVAEKIAAGHEDVPEDWAIHGTTGYRFANVAGGVLVDTAAEAAFARTWRVFTGEARPFAEVAVEAKRSVTANALASDMTVLASMLLRIARADRRTRDFTLNNLRRALAGVAACMSVYRTYVTPEGGASEQDRRFIDEAVDQARARSQLADASVFEFIRRALKMEAPAGGELPDALREQVQRFAARFQQFSAPVAAKGVEDTAFYRWFPLAALNEVGGEPDRFGFTLEAFHAASADRARRWPHTMLATSTHDNKRSEDVRMRIAVLSEMPAAWRLALRRWRALNAPLRERLAARHDGAQPSAADEYLFYQTLLGTWEEGGDAAAWAERIAAYLRKAAREAKLRTSWMQPHGPYEAALEGFARGALADPAFMADFEPLARRLAWHGGLNSLVLMALKYTAPGVPDLYQGNELMDFSLVDPDNRRPVDYARRAALLAAADEADAPPPLAPATLAEAKLWIVSRLLRLRAGAPALAAGSHEPLACGGPAADAVVAYARASGDGPLVLVVAGRFFARQADAAAGARWDAAPWQGTTLALPGTAPWRDVLGGEVHAAGTADLGRLLRRLPCAVLVAQDAGAAA